MNDSKLPTKSIRTRRYTRQSAAPLPHYIEKRIILETPTSETKKIVYVSGNYGLI